MVTRKLNEPGRRAPRKTKPATHKSLAEEIAELTKDIPREEWAKFPRDGAANHDHYIYGAPKRY